MSTKLPLEVQKASWTATSSSTTTTDLTNRITLDANSKYLIIVNIPVSSAMNHKLNLNPGGDQSIRCIQKTRGTGAWIINTSNNSATAAIRRGDTTSTTYSEISNAGLYAIKLSNDGAPYTNNKKGVLLPLDIEKATWIASSSSAANTKLTNTITLQAGHTYLIILNSAYMSTGSNNYPVALYNNITEWGYRNICYWGTAIWIGTARADMTTYALTGYSASIQYSSISEAGLYAIKIS